MTFAVSPRLACVISVWFQPPLLVLLPAVTQQVMGQREGKLRASAKHACRGTAEWSGSVAQIQQRAEYQLRTDPRCCHLCSDWWQADLKRRLASPQTSSLQSCLRKTLRSLSAFFKCLASVLLPSVVEVISSDNSRNHVMPSTRVLFFFSYVSVMYHLHLSDNHNHWLRCCLCLHASNRCGRRPLFWGKNWLNSTRMKCLILNSLVHPW